MTIEILSGSKIRSKILEILLGLYFDKVSPEIPRLYILSPWISDVQIRFGEVNSLRKDTVFLHRYNIESVNLASALLLLRLWFAVEINVVTLPPEYPFYKERQISQTKLFLDFLDEIGCNVFTNANLHAKLVLSNDLALLGSCNLSSSALYDKEELAVCINDLDNLQKLDDYATNIIRLSEPFGFTSMHWSGYDKIYKYEGKDVVPPQYKFTRGWLLEKIIEWIVGRYKTILNPPSLHCCVFVFFEEAKSFYDMANIVFSNLDDFYIGNIEKILALSGDPYRLHLATTTTGSDIYDCFLNLSSAEFKQEIERARKDEHRWGGDSFCKILSLIRNYPSITLDSEGMPSPDSLKLAMDFIKENLARKSMPKIKLRIKSVD